MAERPLLSPDHSKVGRKSIWLASSTVKPAVHTFHTTENLLWPWFFNPWEIHGQTTNSSCRSNISHMNVNGCVDMPMIGPSDRAGQVKSGFQLPLSSVTVLTTAGSERGGWWWWWCECGGWLPCSIMDSTEIRCWLYRVQCRNAGGNLPRKEEMTHSSLIELFFFLVGSVVTTVTFRSSEQSSHSSEFPRSPLVPLTGFWADVLPISVEISQHLSAFFLLHVSCNN